MGIAERNSFRTASARPRSRPVSQSDPAWLAIASSVLIAALSIWWVARHFVHVPYLDQWWLLPLVVAQSEGRLTFEAIWHQNAEHRLLFPKLIMLGLARWSRWDLRWELAANVLLVAVAVGLVWRQLGATWRLVPSARAVWFLPLVSLVMFSPAPFENWLWSWQMPYFLIQICVIVLAPALLRTKRTPRFWGVALGAAAIASLSFATGLALWLEGAIALSLTRTPRRVFRAMLVWLGGFVVLLAVYSFGYERLSWTDPLGALRRPLHLLGYVCVYLGAALVPTHWVTPALSLGVVFLSCWVVMLTMYRSLFCRVRLALAPYLAWMSFVVGAAAITALGRSNVHPWVQAMSPRYITFSQLGWLGLLLAGWVLRSARIASPLVRATAAGALALLVGAFVAMAVFGAKGMVWLSGEMARGKQALVTSPNSEALRILYANPPQLRDEFLPLLKRHRLACFGSTLSEREH